MSFHRNLEIIRMVARTETPATATEIAAHINVPRATVYRLLKTLENEDVLRRSADRKSYELSSGFLQTMIAGASDDQIIAGFEESLICTANNWGATAFLARLSGSLVKIVHAVTPRKIEDGFVHPGNNVRPAHACSASRAILAYLPQRQAARILAEDMSVFTDKTITSRDALDHELALTKTRGYAVCDEEIDIGICSVASPIIVGRAGVVCSMGIVSFSKRIHEQGIRSIGEYLHATTKGAVLNAGQNLYARGA